MYRHVHLAGALFDGAGLHEAFAEYGQAQFLKPLIVPYIAVYNYSLEAYRLGSARYKVAKIGLAGKVVAVYHHNVSRRGSICGVVYWEIVAVAGIHGNGSCHYLHAGINGHYLGIHGAFAWYIGTFHAI